MEGMFMDQEQQQLQKKVWFIDDQFFPIPPDNLFMKTKSLAEIDETLDFLHNHYQNLAYLLGKMRHNKEEYLKNNTGAASSSSSSSPSSSSRNYVQEMVNLMEGMNKFRERNGFLHKIYLENHWKRSSPKRPQSLYNRRNHFYRHLNQTHIYDDWEELKLEYHQLHLRYTVTRLTSTSDAAEIVRQLEDEDKKEDRWMRKIEVLIKNYCKILLYVKSPPSSSPSSDEDETHQSGSNTDDKNVFDDDEELKQRFLNVIHKFLHPHGFHCLNCNNYLDDVVIRRHQQHPLQNQTSNFASSSTDMGACKDGNEDGDEEQKLSQELYLLLNSHNFHCSNCNACISNLIKRRRPASIPEEEREHQMQGPSEAHQRQNMGAIPNNVSITIPNSDNEIMGRTVQHSNIWWESSLKCIAFGGLFSSITSLIIVTSAATANISNGNTVALALANLIPGLFIIRHNAVRVTKRLKHKMEQVNIQHEEIGRGRLFCILYLTITLLSFILFGIVPPLVYGFTFREAESDDNKALKLAATLGASLLCTTLLAVLKALHDQKLQNRPFAYFKAAAYYVSIIFGAFGLSYLAGGLSRKLVEKLGWFE